MSLDWDLTPDQQSRPLRLDWAVVLKKIVKLGISEGLDELDWVVFD